MPVPLYLPARFSKQVRSQITDEIVVMKSPCEPERVAMYCTRFSCPGHLCSSFFNNKALLNFLTVFASNIFQPSGPSTRLAPFFVCLTIETPVQVHLSSQPITRQERTVENHTDTGEDVASTGGLHDYKMGVRSKMLFYSA